MPIESSPPIELPAVGAGRVRVGWGGFALALPAEWNLALHAPARRMAREGLLVFNDLRGVAFEVRWKTPRRLRLLPALPAAALHAAAARLRRRLTVEATEDVCLVPQRGMALVAGARHLYELHCPRAPERLASIARDFAECLRRLRQGPWLWSVYAIEGWLPARARLRAIALRPGECRLSFRVPAVASGAGSSSAGDMAGGGAVTLAGVSLAQQILRGRTLRAWAAAEVAEIRDGPSGEWEECDDGATWRARSRRLGRERLHEAHLRHDAARNCIYWTQIVRPCKNEGAT